MATVWNQHPLWTQQIGGLTRCLGRVPGHSLAARYTSPSRYPARHRKCAAGEGSSSEVRRHEQLLSRQFFLDHAPWWDNRRDKKSSLSPGFRHTGSGEVLRLNKYKPALVDELEVALDMQVGCGALTSMSRKPDKPDPGGRAGYEIGVTGVTVSTLCQQGKVTESVEALEFLAQTDCPISKSLFYTVLKQCMATKDLVLGRRVHAITLKKGYAWDTFLSNHILRMYASHSRLQEAMDVFTRVGTPDAFMWSSIISAHVKQGQAKQAIQLYHQMRNSSVKPDGHVFVAALQACARGGDLETGQQVHADLLASGIEPDLFVVGCLVDMYAKCGRLKQAQTLFDRLLHKNVVMWNVMIAGYSQQGMGEEALHLYSAMQEEGISAPDSVTFVCLLQACASVGTMAMEKGKYLQAQIGKRGLEADVVVGCSLVNMYAKCGSLKDAQSVFDRLPQKNVVTWNTMIAGYTKCGMLEEAQRLFDRLPQKDVVTWTAMIAGYYQEGMGQKALHLYSAMQEDGISVPDSVTFACLLQACASVGTTAMEKGKQLHAQIEERGLEADVGIGNSLVNMYAKCASLKDAQSVFDRLPEKNVVTWNTMITAYSQQGMGEEALHLYSTMVEEAITPPDSFTFVCVLQACASVGTTALEKGKQLNAQVRERGLEADVVVGCSLVNMYAKCGSLEDAQSMFDRLPKKNVVTWTTMIAGYSQQGMGEEALHLYSAMQEEGITAPDSVTFVCLLQACASVGTTAIEKGKELHAQIGERGLDADVVVGGSLVNMYAKCGSLEDSQRVFDRLSEKPIMTWNAMIAGYSQQGMAQEALDLYNTMEEEGITAPDSVTFVCLLQACVRAGTTALEKGKQVHAKVQERGLEADVAVRNSLVNMYAKCGSLKDAQSVFDKLPEKDVVTWTTMIARYCQEDMGQEALCVYRAMQEDGVIAPDSVAFACLLQACASIGTTAMEKGKQLHAQIKEEGLETNRVVGGSLVNMYAKCGSLEDAHSVFDRLPEKNVVAWTAIIAGYSQGGLGQEALHLYSAMQKEGITTPDSVTFVCLLQACANVGTTAMEKGKQLHTQIGECGLEADVVVGCSLVNMYAKCGSLEDAQSLFDRLPEKDVVTWNAMIAGYSQQGRGEEALHLYSIMQENGITAPDSVTFVCLLQACASVGALPLGKQLHAQIEERGLETDGVVGGSLVNMYAKCGSMIDAQRVFDILPIRVIVAWNALIAGYSRQGDSEVVFDLVHRMREECRQPDDITFLSILTVCSHAGLVNKGHEYFEAMTRKYRITPSLEHYTCMVDLLGRAGGLEEALEVVRRMPVQPDGVVWHALLGACQNWRNVEVGRHAFDEAVKLNETDAAAYVMMSNIYTGAQMWEEAQEIQARRIKIGAWKQPGESWWTDPSGRVHSFLVDDRKHPESEGIYARLEQLVPKMKTEGYVPPLDTSLRGTLRRKLICVGMCSEQA